MRAAAAFAASIVMLAACGQESASGVDADSAPPMTSSVRADPAPPHESSATSASPSRALQAAPLTPDGIGPIRIGMTEAEVAGRLGPSVSGVAGAANDCHFLTPLPTPPTLFFMIENGRLARITVRRGSAVRTAQGFGPGATAAEVRRAHGEALSREPHKYVEGPAEYLTAWTRPDQAGVRYVVGKDGRVEEIHAGGPAIAYVEGCS